MRSPSREDTGVSKRRANGFTLVEVLVVLVILGLLAGIISTAAIRYLSKAKSDIARIQLENISTSLDLFRLDMGRYPKSEEGLQALVRRPAGLAKWKGPYIDGNEVPTDPWERPYLYERSAGGGGRFNLTTLGADGVQGGEGEDADISAR
ncbi:MAG: type II secretion system major pseudopilin GspG [Rhodospirillales bacterium]